MKKSTLLCTLFIAASSTQVMSSSYAKKIEQNAFKNHHNHQNHGGATYFATIKFEKASADAQAAQTRTSPINPSPTTTTRPFSPVKTKGRTNSL